MASPEHLNNYLFGSHFKRTHSMSVEQALSGRVVPLRQGGDVRLVKPEEYQEHWKGTAGYNPRFAENWREEHAQLTAPTNPERFIRKLQGDHGIGEALIGDPFARAAEIRDFTRLMRTQGRTNEVPLYRGANRAPEQDIGEERDKPLSFTEDRHVAYSFARTGMKAGFRIKEEPGAVRGLPLHEHGGIPRTVGKNRRPEREWLVDPQSYPKK